MSAVEAYLDPVAGSRRAAIGRAQRAGGYDRLPGLRVVTGYHARSRLLYVAGESGSRPVSVDVVGADERRRLFRRTPAGLEPLAGGLGPGGVPKKAPGRADTFAPAQRRVQHAWAAAG